MARSKEQGTYRVSAKAKDVVAGNWYFGVTCLVCDKPIELFDDKSAGKAPIKFEGEGHFRVKCPHCDSDRLYPADEVQRWQAA